MNFYVMFSLILMVFNSILYVCGRPRIEQHFYPVIVTDVEMALTIIVGSLLPGVRWIFTLGMLAIVTGAA